MRSVCVLKIAVVKENVVVTVRWHVPPDRRLFRSSTVSRGHALNRKWILVFFLVGPLFICTLAGGDGNRDAPNESVMFERRNRGRGSHFFFLRECLCEFFIHS